MQTGTVPPLSDQEKKIINSPSPFIQIRYEKGKRIDNFVGRSNELSGIADMLNNTVQTNLSAGIKIAGPGGSGKSTLFGYFAQLIRNDEIYDNPCCKFDKNKVRLFVAFIDAPKGEPMTVKYFWNAMLSSWDEEKINFLEMFASYFILKCLIVFWENDFQKEEISKIFQIVHPNFSDELKRNGIRDIFTLKDNWEKLMNQITDDKNLLEKVKNLIYSGFRILQKQKISLANSTDITIRVEKNYIDNVFNVLHNDFDTQQNAKHNLSGESTNLIISDSQTISLMNWFAEAWSWIEEKQVSFAVGIDNIGYMTADLPDKSTIYPSFAQTILQLRNSVKGFLFVLIGINNDWTSFNDYIKNYKSLASQLNGFFMKNIELLHLNEKETVQALSMLMAKFWVDLKQPIPHGDALFPFSKEFFEFLYDYNTHDYRETLSTLNNIWSHFKKEVKITPLKNPFDIIMFMHFDFSDEEAQDLHYSNLKAWEKDKIFEWFNTISSSFKAKEQSSMAENVIYNFLEILMDKEDPKQIRIVSKTGIKIVTRDGNTSLRIPDVYAELEPRNPFDENRAFEIQVKIHEQDKEVKLPEIESSLELLQYLKTDALLFVMTGPGLESNAIQKIKSLALQDRIIHAKSLTESGRKMLAFMCAYEKITSASPSVDVIKEMFSGLFGIAWDELLEKIRNLGAFKEHAIKVKKETEAASTLDGFTPDAKRRMKPVKPPKQVTLSIPKVEETNVEMAQAQASSSSTGNLNQEQSQDSQASKLESPKTDGEQKPIPAQVTTKVGLDPLHAIYHKYESVIKEVQLIMDEAMKRTPRDRGRITWAYMKNRIPRQLTEDTVHRVFTMLQKDAQKPSADKIFNAVTKLTMEITDLGKEFIKFASEHE